MSKDFKPYYQIQKSAAFKYEVSFIQSETKEAGFPRSLYEASFANYQDAVDFITVLKKQSTFKLINRWEEEVESF